MATAIRPRPAHEEPAGAVDFTIITGLSGAGRSEAAKCFEDLGYFVVDNLPPALIGKMAELATSSGNPARVAIVADVRGGVFFGELSRGLEELKAQRIPYRILFLDAADDDLVKRYESTRRRHPLASDDRVVEGIRKERLMMQSLKESADLIIDSTGMSPYDLRDRVRDLFARSPAETRVQVSIVTVLLTLGIGAIVVVIAARWQIEARKSMERGIAIGTLHTFATAQGLFMSGPACPPAAFEPPP